jgi:hypothetical protein
MEACPLCGFEFCEAWVLYHHVWWSHIDVYACWCGEEFEFPGLFARHLHCRGGLEAHYLECRLG